MKSKETHLPVWVLLCNRRDTPYAVSQTRKEALFFKKHATKISKRCRQCRDMKWKVVKGCVRYSG